MALAAKSQTLRLQKAPRAASRKAVVVRADASYLGSTTNLIMVASTAATLTAARFGLAPSVKKVSTAGLKLVDREVPFVTNDPAGFTAVDVLAMGAAGHILGVGIVLGLKGIGQL